MNPEPELPEPLIRGLHAAFGRAATPEPAATPGPAPRPGTGGVAPGARYELGAELGRGGMGIVFRGRDVDLGRDVAMKLLRREHAHDPAAIARFVAEAQIGGQLQHPGIVPVYELGLWQEEQPYLAMKLIQGETLAAVLARGDLALRRHELLRVFEHVCQAVAYAHARGVVHRDLKPGNVMIGSFGEVQVVDWGFAKVLPSAPGTVAGSPVAPDTAAVATRRTQPGAASSVAGAVLGTPAYMPPEQALGQLDGLDTRSDVWGLGALLCELLTGLPPYDPRGVDVLGQAARAELGPALARLAQCGAEAELLDLCRSCLAAAPAARPADAGQVAARVRAWLGAVAERAQAAQVRAAAARVRARATLWFAAAAVLVLAGAAGVWSHLLRADAARTAAATHAVATALQAATTALGAARAHGDDLAAWDQAQAAAAQAAALARQADVAPATRGRALELAAGVQAEHRAARVRRAQQARDQVMRARLAALRIPDDDDVRATGWTEREAQRLDAAYAAAFAEHRGQAWADADTDTLLAEFRGSALATELAAALDHWAMARDQLQGPPTAAAVAATAALRALARGLDPSDAWRNLLRALLPATAAQRGAMERVAAAADLAALPVPSLVLLGEALWHAGARDQAVAVLRRAQALHPDDFGLAFRLGVALECQEPPQFAEAGACYRVALALRPQLREVRHRLGLALFQQRAWSAAAAVFADLVRDEPDSAHWHTHLGDSQQARHQTDAALASYRRALELDPTRAPAHNGLALALLARGDLAGAEVACQRALALDPRGASPHVNQGLVLLRRGQAAAAVQSLERAVAMDPHSTEAHFDLGLALRAAGRLDAAIASLRRAVALDGQRAECQDGLGVALAERGAADEAVWRYRRALELDPRRVEAHVHLGHALLRQNRSADGIASFRAALALDEARADAHNGLGILLARQGDLDAAIASYRRAIALQPDQAVSHGNLGAVLAKQGHLDDAIACYERALALDPTAAEVHVNLGLARADQGDLEAAVACHRKALTLQPRLAAAHAGLGAALGRQGQLEAAVASYRAALALDPALARVHDHLGGALVRLGRPGEAIPSFRRASELMPQLVPPLVHLAWLHVTAADAAHRDAPEAVRLARRAVDLAPEDPAALLCLGVAQLRTGDATEAATVLQRALPLQKGAWRAACARFLAMALAQTGQGDAARRAFDHGLRALAAIPAPEAELLRVRAEAEQALGIQAPGR